MELEKSEVEFADAAEIARNPRIAQLFAAVMEKKPKAVIVLALSEIAGDRIVVAMAGQSEQLHFIADNALAQLDQVLASVDEQRDGRLNG